MNSTMIDLGFISVKWYSVILLIAVVIGGLLLLREGRKFNFNRDFLFNLFFWVIIFGFIGARTYYVVFNFDLYKDNLISIFKIWEGGLAIHGGIIAGFLVMIIYCKKYNARLFKITDMTVPSLILAQAIGRWGNFFNQEAHGAITTFEHLKSKGIPEFIINGMNIGGFYYTPTFLYESLWCLLGFLVLIIIRNYKYLKVGQLSSIYLIWYGIGRFIIEAQRTDSLMMGGFKVAQLISIIMFVCGAIAFMILSRKSKFENLYKEVNADNIRF